MHPSATPAAVLFAYAFLSNIALAVVPHEPAIIWYGPRLGVWTTTLIATAGTILAAVVDHRLLAPLIGRLAQRRLESSPLSATRRGGPGVRTWPERLFRRYPVATIALSGLTPLPFFPFKALALDRKSTRLNSSHSQISYAVFCLKKKKTTLLQGHA